MNVNRILYPSVEKWSSDGFIPARKQELELQAPWSWQRDRNGILVRGAEKSDSQTRAKIIQDAKQRTLYGEVKANVEPGAEVFTDAHRGNQGLDADLELKWVDHAVDYVQGRVHTNGVENFWSLFDLIFHGTYTHMESYHLQRYIDEQVFRFNARKDNDAGRFNQVVSQINGKRLTYTTLIESRLVNPEAEY